MPTANELWRVARYYALDIFRGEDHPYRKHFRRKHNPMQAVTDLALKMFLFPVIWLSGLAYLSYGLWSQGAVTNAALEGVALVHTAAAFAMLVFISLHIYLLATGHSFIGHVRPMIEAMTMSSSVRRKKPISKPTSPDGFAVRRPCVGFCQRPISSNHITTGTYAPAIPNRSL